MFAPVLAKHLVSALETTLHTHPAFTAFLIVSCSTFSFVLSLFLFSAPLSQRALCHSQDPLLRFWSKIEHE